MAEVKAVCKRCGKHVGVNDLSLDPVYRMVVCSHCIRERKGTMKPKEDIPPKPRDWDAEDEYLERAYKEKKGESSIVYEKPGVVKYTCYKCKKTFGYNVERKHPNLCPYCGSTISVKV